MRAGCPGQATPRGWRSCWTRWRSGRRHSHSFGRGLFIQHLFLAIEQGVTEWSMSATTSISSSSPSPQDPTQHGSSNLGTGEEDLWQGQLHHPDGRHDQSWPPKRRGNTGHHRQRCSSGPGIPSSPRDLLSCSRTVSSSPSHSSQLSLTFSTHTALKVILSIRADL